MTARRKAIRRAFPDPVRSQGKRRSWIFRIWRILTRPSPSLSEMLPAPDFHSHPFSAGPAFAPSWYALLVPTHEEGHDVLNYLGNVSSWRASDITYFIGFADDDPTKDKIYEAAALNQRIVPVPAPNAKPWVLEIVLEDALKNAENLRDRSVTDAVIVPLPEIIIKRR